MKQRFALVVFALVLFPGWVLCSDGNLDSARTALLDGFPEVAAKKMEAVHPGIAKGSADAEAVVLYARALLESERTGEAEGLLVKTGRKLGAAGDFWLAQTYAAQGRYKEALTKFQAASSDPDLSREAVIGQAKMFCHLGQFDEATKSLEPAFGWPDSPVKMTALLDLAETQILLKNVSAAQRALDSVRGDFPAIQTRLDFLKAKCLVLRGDDMGAIAAFSGIVPLDSLMATEIVCARAAAMLRVGQVAAAEAILEEFVGERPNVPGLENVFVILDRIFSIGESELASELKRWADDSSNSLRRKLARFYLARQESRENRPERAAKILEQTVSVDRDGNPVLAQAKVELAALRLQDGKPDGALELLPPPGEWSRADYLRGLAFAASGRSSDAVVAFLTASSDPALAESSLYNAAICEILAGTGSKTAFALLEEKFPDSRKIAAVRLQEAYDLARKHDVRAASTLQKLELQPNSDVAGRAALALAGLKYQQGDVAGARQDLQRASIHRDADPASAAALAVFLADTGQPDADAAPIAAARKFLSDFPGSAPEAEVRMKLGELLYRKGDFASARVEFESLARKFPGSALEAPAFFLAAQATARLLTAATASEAMVLFEEVASTNSPLAVRARFEQALLHNAQGRPKEAIVILDRILASKPDSDNMAAAQLEKGKTLYSLGVSNPASYRAAIDVWKLIVNSPDASHAAKNQALVRMGAAYEKLSEDDSALACYYDVVKAPQGPLPEFFWFYKAGFSATRILEAQKKWREAVKIYDLMAQANGPRSDEIRSRINKLRLENFLWDGQQTSRDQK